MKKLSFLVLILCSSIAGLAIEIDMQKRMKPQAVGVVTEGFQVSATAEKESIVSGAPARLNVRIRNIKKRNLNLAEAGPERSYKLKVYGDSGRTIPLTEHGKGLMRMEGEFITNIGLTVKPGQELEDSLEVSNIFDMSAPGHYWVVARRKVPKLNGTGVAEAESNTVHFEILKK